MADIIDAEIVKDIDDADNGDSDGTPTVTTVAGAAPPKTIVDLSLDSAPEWKKIVVEFVERTPSGNLRVIPCQMPFTADLDGVTYSIGMPHEDTVAILTDDEDGQPALVDPDDDNNEEVFQLAATALIENMGDKLRLRRTPRVLTVQGDLRGVTGKHIKDSDVDTNSLLDETDEDDKFLDDFFREQLGDGYEEKFGIDSDDGVTDEEAERFLKMFDVPGLGTEEDNEEAIQSMLRDIVSGEDEGEDAKKKEAVEKEVEGSVARVDQADKALPLFPFTGPDGRNYAFVQMARNPLLVGREDPNIKNSQRMLLSAEEAAEILPRLEEQFHEELSEAGLIEE